MSKIKIFGLGGLNESGKNMYVVEVDNDIFIFDAGLKYADDALLGVDYIIPNYDYVKENKDRVKGIFITHAHDSEMGAVVDILTDIPELKIYLTKFSLDMLKDELEEENMKTETLIEIKAHKKIDFGENSIFPISLTNSIPDAVGYVLNTKDGAIFYTGNFAFDPTMLGSHKTDIGKLAYVGKQGVLCLMAESRYAERPGYTSPQHRTTKILREITSMNNGRILINVLNTQINRLQELLNEAIRTHRKVVIMGKKLEKIITRAIDDKYLEFDKSNLLSIRNLKENDKNVIIVISDEREKPFSNLWRIVKGYDKFIKLAQDDTIVISSPIYDGLEKSATDLFDRIAKMDVKLIILSTKNYLSLHASSEDLMMMIDLMQPKYYFPVIGEYRHQVENANLAKTIGMKEENIILKLNGQIATFIDGILQPETEHLKVDDILIDGKIIGDIGEIVIRDREILSENGIVVVIVTLDKITKEVIAGPEILTRGFIYVKDNIDLIKEAENLSLEVINENIKPNYVDFNKIKTGIRDRVGKYLYHETECKPMVLIVLQEV